MKLLALVAVLVVAATGGISYAALRSTPSSDAPLAHWGLYSDAEWDGLATAFEGHGFEGVRLVTGTSTMSGHRSFALIAARSRSGRECFAVARGTSLGTPACRFAKPLTVYRWRDGLLALVRKQVGSVTMSGGGSTTNVELPSASARFYAFNGGLTARPLTVVAHAADGTVLQSVTVR